MSCLNVAVVPCIVIIIIILYWFWIIAIGNSAASMTRRLKDTKRSSRSLALFGNHFPQPLIHSWWRWKQKFPSWPRETPKNGGSKGTTTPTFNSKEPAALETSRKDLVSPKIPLQRPFHFSNRHLVQLSRIKYIPHCSKLCCYINCIASVGQLAKTQPVRLFTHVAEYLRNATQTFEQRTDSSQDPPILMIWDGWQLQCHKSKSFVFKQ